MKIPKRSKFLAEHGHVDVEFPSRLYGGCGSSVGIDETIIGKTLTLSILGEPVQENPTEWPTVSVMVHFLSRTGAAQQEWDRKLRTP